MIRNKVHFLAWSFCLGVLALVIVTPYLKYRLPRARVVVYDVAADISIAIFLLLFAVIAALIISRQPGNTIGWLMMIIAVSNSLTGLLGYFLQLWSPSPSQPTLGLYLMVWFDIWGWWLAMGPLLLVLLLFPTGRLPSPRWRWVIYLILFSFVFFMLVTTFSPTLESTSAPITLQNPFGWLDETAATWLVYPFEVLLVICAISCGAGMLVRFRRAQMVEKAQMKWLLYACAFFLLDLSLGFLGEEDSRWGFVFYLSIIGIPLAIGAAILRYHLWDIDLIIRRSLVYVLLSGLLGLLYYGSVVVLRQMLGGLTGTSSVALVISTLMIAALFNPLRRRIQAGIDRRFYRRKYNAEQALLEFANTARSETELDAVTAELQRVVSETMQPEQVTMWLGPAATSKAKETT